MSTDPLIQAVMTVTAAMTLTPDQVVQAEVDASVAKLPEVLQSGDLLASLETVSRLAQLTEDMTVKVPSLEIAQQLAAAGYAWSDEERKTPKHIALKQHGRDEFCRAALKECQRLFAVGEPMLAHYGAMLKDILPELAGS